MQHLEPMDHCSTNNSLQLPPRPHRGHQRRLRCVFLSLLPSSGPLFPIPGQSLHLNKHPIARNHQDSRHPPHASKGNRPPWTLPAKAAYGVFDARRSIARHPGLRVQFPDDLMTRGKTMLVRSAEAPLPSIHH